MPSPRMRFGPDEADDAQATIEELVAGYESWYRSQHPGAGDVDGSDVELLLDWKVNYGDGCLDEWSAGEVEQFLLDWCPRKVSAPPSWAVNLVEAVANGFTYLGEQGLLSGSSDRADRLAAHTRSLATQCQQRMADPSNFGMAKSLFAGMGVDFEEEVTQEGLNHVMDQFNALSFEERKSLTDPFLGAGQQEQPRIGPVLLPTEEEVRTAANAAPVLAGFRALCDYFEAPGRPLTAAGNIKLADADALSGILGSEPVEEVFGGRRIRSQSSADMPNFDHWQWWAREVGALRVVKSRVVGVKSWRVRCDKNPLSEATKAFNVLLDYGVASSRQGRYIFDGDRVIDDVAIPVLTLGLVSPHPLEFTRIVEVVTALREEYGVPSVAGDPEVDRHFVASDVDRMLAMVERAGVVTQQDVQYEASRWGQRRTGGTVSLTPFGIVMVVEQTLSAGVEVETIDSPEWLSERDLAELVEQQEIDVEVWWGILTRWLAARKDRRRALAGLFETLTASGLMVLLAFDTPDDLIDDFGAVLLEAFDTRGADDPVAVVAYGWLLQYGLLDPGSVSLETLQRARLALIGLGAETDPESIGDIWGAGQSRPELLAEITEISQLLPANAEVLLEAIGRHYPDPVVAKSARRELLKVRSRLANRRRP